MKKNRMRLTALAMSLLMAAALASCSGGNKPAETASETVVVTESVSETAIETTSESETAETESTAKSAVPAKDRITVNETYENTEDGGHAILADGEDASYANIGVTKTGESEGDEADFYGENAAVFATNEAALTISDSLIETNGTHANGVFSYGEGTTVNISDSVIETSGNCSGGIMTTGGGTMNASNLNIHTTGNSSAAIRSDRGGGTVTVDGGSYVTDGMGSPVIYSTADITVSDSYMESTASQGVVVEGKNSVTLNDCELVADNNTKNSDKSDYYQAVMIYQSMSGDAASGTSSFTMNGGSLLNKNGDIFFVNNTACEISMSGVDVVNEDADGIFLRAEAAGWGNEGSNGGKINFTASGQTIDSDMVVDEVSVLNLYLKDGSAFTGAINTDGQAGSVYVELDEGSTWTLTGDSYISGLTCDADAINLNGYTLYVDGEAYTAGSESTGEAFEIVSESSGMGEGMPEGPGGEGMPEPPDGEGHGPGGDGMPEPPEGGEPPAKPGE